MSESQCDGWPSLIQQHMVQMGWVLISALELSGFTKCHICHVGCSGVWCFCWTQGGLVPSPLSAMAGWGGVPRLLCGLSFVWNKATWAWIKPYLRGFRTDGDPLFEDVFIIRKWGNDGTSQAHPTSLINTPHPLFIVSLGFGDSSCLISHWIVGSCTLPISSLGGKQRVPS